MTEWKEYKLSDIVTIVGGATPSTKDASNYDDGEIAWLTPKDLSTFTERYISRGERNITEKGFKSSSTQMLPANTVLFSSRAPIGYVAIAANEMCTNQGFKSIIPNSKVDYLFLYYLLKYKKNAIEGMGSGTTFKEVSGNVMKNIEVQIPTDINIQKKIADVLDKIDSKIENNTAINRNLLNQANALYKSWFVEYEPFDGSRPDDWKEGILDDIIEFSNGYAFKGKELLDAPDSERDCYHVFKQGHINRGGGFNITGTKSWYPKDLATNLQKYVLHKGDVLMAMTDMKDNVAILGNTAIMEIDGEYIVNQRVGLLRPTGIYGIQYPYISLLTNSYDFLKDLRSRANSGVQVNLSSNEIRDSSIYIAPESVNKEFNELVMPLFEVMIANDIENLRLVDLRDGLLPKLMSGELDVSDLDI